MRIIFLILIGFSSLSFAEFSKEEGVVGDSVSKLEWQDDYSDNGGDIKQLSWSEAINYCETLTLNGGRWRLPNIKELTSLIEDTTYNPSISSTFEFISSDNYWSSTVNVNASNYAWIVYFSSGNIHIYDKKHTNYVRCVRAGEE
jgi:hypothetical protein